MGARLLANEGDGAVEFPGFLVGTDRGKRIEDIGERHDAPEQGNSFAGQPAGIAAAVELLVVAEGDHRGRLQDRRLTAVKDVIADRGVLFHNHYLVVGKLPGLEQDVVGRTDLADVMHRCGFEDSLLLSFREPMAAAISSE